MQVLDYYVRHLRRQEARTLVLHSDQPVVFRFADGEEQRSAQPLEHDVLLRLLQEEAPPEVLMELRKHAAVRFAAATSDGVAVVIDVRAETAKAWTISIELVPEGGAPPEPKLELAFTPSPRRAHPEPRPEPIRLSGAPAASASAPSAPPLARASVAAPALPPIPTDSLDGLLDAMRTRAVSDVHLIAERPPLGRVAGALTPMGSPLSAEHVERLIQPIVPERLRGELASDGAVDFAYETPRAGRARVNVSRQRTGLKACFRMIPREVPTLDSFGLPAELRRVTQQHQGLVVITGPTGHGKSTTLAAIVDALNAETTHHVICVEDPIEFIHPRKRAMMSQREVGTDTRSFQNALKGSLREDPDVIVVGELRDTETVRIALAASETGHLVIGTMNTPSAAKTIDRLIDLFPPGDQPQVRMTLAGGLRLVVSQRLVPRIDGRGMAAAVEMLPGIVPLWNLIRDGKTFQIPSLQQRGKALGITRLDDSLVDLVQKGVATLEAVREVAEAPDEVEQRVTGQRPVAPGKRG